MTGLGRFVLVILDSFGVGAMEDVVEVRPRDIGSNTALHILEQKPDINVPNMEKLGLMNAIGVEWGSHNFSDEANYGTSDLAHYGADSFLGHQEIMGTTPKMPLIEAFNHVIDHVEAELIKAGYSVRRYGDTGTEILIVNDLVTVGDNLETDYGQVYNVTGCLDYLSFRELKAIGEVVRRVVKVSRVITFGGRQVNLDNLLAAYKTKNNEIAGVDAPESGVYNHDYHVIHLGYGIDKYSQIPTILDQAGITVALLGKAADIIQTDSQHLFPGVDSDYLFEALINEINNITHGFIALNIQETDLAGHAQDVERYANRLELSDRRIGELIPLLNDEDVLIVTADHGNDPTIGHSNHTREKVPILLYQKGKAGIKLGHRHTMADIAATVADYFSVTKPQNGESFWPLIREN